MTKIAVAVLHHADSRALRLTLTALAPETARAAKIVVVGQAAGERPIRLPDARGWPELDLEFLEVPAHDNARNSALRRVQEFDCAILMREGMVLKDGFLSRAASDGRCAARLFRAARSVDINELSSAELATPDPFALGERRFPRPPDRLLSTLRSRYFAPSVIILSPEQVRGVWFEAFAARSDWAACRLFLDAASRQGPVAERTDMDLLYIGRQPDRRGGYEQGRACSTELHRLAEAFPAYKTRAWVDRRLLALEQILMLASARHRRPAWAFLRGMLSQRREEAALRGRLQRDVAKLS